MHDLFDVCSCHTGCNEEVPHIPLIGDSAPEFMAATTNGMIDFPSDFSGRWVVLFSHPGDFTPVCTSEFMAFQHMVADLAEINTMLVGLSVGGISSHLAWIDAIEKIKWNGMENTEITFPIIEDPGMRIAKMYGMVHPNASDAHAVRAVFIIDPHGIVRAILYYPASTGRNMDEIKRMLVALQTSDKFHVSTPADWVPGDDVLIGSPQTTVDMRRTMQSANMSRNRKNVQAWFMIFRPLPANEIESKLRVSRPAKNKGKNIK